MQKCTPMSYMLSQKRTQVRFIDLDLFCVYGWAVPLQYLCRKITAMLKRSGVAPETDKKFHPHVITSVNTYPFWDQS